MKQLESDASSLSIIEIARSEIGTGETPKGSNITKYGAWYGRNGVSWCGILASYCYYFGGFPLTGIQTNKGFASCHLAYEYFKKTNQLTDTPKQNDLVFYDWNGDGHYDHVGIYDTHLDDTHFQAIEGNTSDVVAEKRRKYSANVVFVHPVILDKVI